MLIMGGGIAGTSLAAFMEKDERWQVDLIEKGEKWRTGGYNIGLWMGGKKVLEALGVEKDFYKNSKVLDRTDLLDEKGKILGSVSFKKFIEYGTIGTIAKKDLHQLLIQKLGSTKVSFSTRIVGIEKTERSTSVVTFSNGRRKEYDLIVGADGIRSQTRDIAFEKTFAEPYGWILWSFWLPPQFRPPDTVSVVFGKKSLLFFFPTKSSCSMGVIYKQPKEKLESPDFSYENLCQATQEFGSRIKSIITSVNSSSIVFADSLMRVKMDQWYKDSIVLIGDAQHGLSPIAGLGASLAIEDAMVLSDELSKVENEELKLALERFSIRRDKKIANAKFFLHRAEKMSMSGRSRVAHALRKMAFRILPNFIVSPIERYLKAPL